MALGWRSQYTRYKEFFLSIISLYRKRQDLQMFLEILLSLAATTFFVVFALRPTLITVSQLVKDIRNKEEIISQMDQKITNLKEARQVYDQESARIFLVNEAVPENPSPEIMSRQFEGVTQKFALNLIGVSIEQVQIVGSEKPSGKSALGPLPEGAKEMAFTLTTSASSYTNVLPFMFDLEQLRRPVKIDSLGISSIEDDTGAVSLVILITGRVPYQ